VLCTASGFLAVLDACCPNMQIGSTRTPRRQPADDTADRRWARVKLPCEEDERGLDLGLRHPATPHSASTTTSVPIACHTEHTDRTH
jgi:hypothetical protein